MPWHPLDQDLPEEDQVTNDDLMLILAGEVLPRDLRGRKLALKERAENEIWRKEFQNNLTGYFESLGTDHLIKILRQSYKHHGKIWVCGYGRIDFHDKFEGGKTAEQILRSVLSQRPHLSTRKQVQTARHRGRQHHNGFRR